MLKRFFVCLSVNNCIHRSFDFFPRRLFVCLFDCSFVRSFARSFVRLFVCLFVCLFAAVGSFMLFCIVLLRSFSISIFISDVRSFLRSLLECLLACLFVCFVVFLCFLCFVLCCDVLLVCYLYVCFAETRSVRPVRRASPRWIYKAGSNLDGPVLHETSISHRARCTRQSCAVWRTSIQQTRQAEDNDIPRGPPPARR